MNKETILKQIGEKNFVVKFIKANGEERTMKATRNLGAIPSEKHPKGTGPIKPDNLITAFDLEKSEWRSFKVESIISIEVE